LSTVAFFEKSSSLNMLVKRLSTPTLLCRAEGRRKRGSVVMDEKRGSPVYTCHRRGGAFIAATALCFALGWHIGGRKLRRSIRYEYLLLAIGLNVSDLVCEQYLVCLVGCKKMVER
ncbi:hypothetical protein KCU62_g135, partial [Aureobasidium sp. EXF-3399]